MTDKPKFRVGDIVGSRSNPGIEYEVTNAPDGVTVDLKVVKGVFGGEGGTYYSCGTKHLFLLRPAVSKPDAQDGLTILDAEGRAALKVGDRVLVAAEVRRRAMDGAVEVGDVGGTHTAIYTSSENVYAKLPAAETKKEIAVGDFVSILRRTGSKGRVLAFMSNGHAVVEYAAGDDFNVGHYDVSCLEVI
ncbi:MAG TPA: hypothetical protein PL098_00050 [Brevundimonas diminuta]|nr:hypothetical protein [Brevundimonas diminuta]HRL23295.1 hypothetical protein [Brevundimonas diminuta]